MSGADNASSGKKIKDRIQQLSELRRGLVHHTDAQYGTPDDPLFVMHIDIDGMVFQGIGPSKKRAKIMASERALAYIGAIDASEVQVPELETPQVDDYTADVFTGLLYSNFESPNTNPTRFVTAVRVRGRSYCGDAKNKRISKGRAAAVALTDIYGIEFSTAEDGMPLYEGSTKVWENYKAQLEQEVEMQAVPINVVNPVEQLNEMFPEAEFQFPDGDEKCGGFFRAQFTIGGTTYEGLGLNKRDAKANAAANTVEGLEKSGLLAERQGEIDAKRKERGEKGETGSEKPAREKSSSAVSSHNPNVRLQEIYPSAVFHILGETPLRNTAIRAFIGAVIISDQTYIGVGRSKKLAKTAAAEKALRALGYWTEDDELAKMDRLKADRATVPPLIGAEGLEPPPDAELHALIGSFTANRFGRLRRGWNFGPGSRGYPMRGRGRGFAAGYGGQDWYGGGTGDTFGDMMVGELSQIVGQILEGNPSMGVSDVWHMLQQNPEYQSWRRGAIASNMQSYYQDFGGDPYGEEYYGYSGDGYNYPQEPYAGGSYRGVNVRSWSRDTGMRRGRGGNTYSYW